MSKKKNVLTTFKRKLEFRGSHFALIQGERVTIKSGGIVKCLPHELGGFISQYEVIKEPPPEILPPVLDEYKLYKVKHTNGSFDVMNPQTDKPINDVPLSEAEADTLLSKENPPPSTTKDNE